MSKITKTEDFVKTQLLERAIEKYEKETNELKEKERSDNLAGYFVETILPELGYPEVVDLFTEGYTDGGNELDIDILISANGNTHFIQSKYRGYNSTIQRNHIEDFQGILTRLGNQQYEKHTNKRLKELLNYVNFKTDNLHFWFVTNLPIKNQAEAAKENETYIPDSLKTKHRLEPDRVFFHYIDQQAIYDIIGFAQSEDSRLGVDQVKIHAAKKPKSKRTEIIEIDEQNYSSAILIIESEQIAQICRRYTQKLFDYNIRNYIGESKKNKAIAQTARDDTANFFLFNNGISAICEDYEIDHEESSIVAQRFSVINGAQTVRILSGLAGEERQSYPKVMLRITKIPNHKSRNSFLRDVVKYNNTQNEIKTSDFRSNDKIQKSFVEAFERLTKDGKVCRYFPKRSYSTERQVVKIDMTEFAKAIFNYKFNTYELVGMGATILFDLGKPDSAAPYYCEIFGKENDTVHKDDFEYRAGIYFVSEFLNEWLSGEKKLLRGKEDETSRLTLDAIERKNIFLWLLEKLLTRLSQETNFDEKIFFQRIARSKTALNLENKNDKYVRFLTNAFETLKQQIRYEYARLKRDNKMTNRQWVRGTDEISHLLKTGISEGPNLLATLTSLVESIQKVEGS